MSDSEFDDDDDDLLLQLVGATQKPVLSQNNTSVNLPSASAETQQQLFRAQGEISILRAQLEALQQSRNEEIARLSAETRAVQSSAKEHVDLLKQTVDKLEDEKKFLGNEVRSLSAVKRRKTNGSDMVQATQKEDMGPSHSTLSNTALDESRGTVPRFQLQDDWSQLCQHLWQYTINGAERTSMQFLAKICTEITLHTKSGLVVHANTPISTCLWDSLLQLKHLRLDMLVEQVCESVLELVTQLLQQFQLHQPGQLLPVPFLISIIHAALNFKPSAVTQPLASTLVAGFCQIAQRFVSMLHVNSEEEDEAFSGNIAVPYQQRVIENFILLSAVDVLETIVVISTQFGPDFSRNLWASGTLAIGLMQQVLPENTERFVSSVQINLVTNFVEILSASVNEDTFCTSDVKLNSSIVKSLLKVFIIDIRIKDDFMFYGLNRVLGNNHDFGKISEAVPSHPEKTFNKSLVATPYPVKKVELGEKQQFRLAFQHDCHLLTLRVRTVMLLEALVVSNNMALINSKENIKSIVRIIGYEQNHVIHQPRYELVHMRLAIIGGFVRILYYIIEEQRNINTLLYPETLYEIFVVLSRIAFASDSLSFEAHELLLQIRARGFTDIGVFNKSCELRSREMAHFDLYSTNASKFADLAGIEGDFANGLEFPYESDTIEIAREILSVCVNHDEADNLYYNMNKETQT